MRERKPLPARPEDIRIPKFLEIISRKKGTNYRAGNAKRMVVDFGVGGALRGVTFPVEVVLRRRVLKRMGAPTLYFSERVDSNGEVLRIPKIRTMENGADALGTRHRVGNTFSDSTDPRVTELGRIFRDWDIDELPQLKLVRRGKMSLVELRGYTPECEKILAEVLGEKRFEKRRVNRKLGKSGIIHPAAVFARDKIRENDPTMGVEWDEWYAENACFGADLYMIYLVLMQRARKAYEKISNK